jgi:hypothetical protein
MRRDELTRYQEKLYDVMSRLGALEAKQDQDQRNFAAQAEEFDNLKQNLDVLVKLASLINSTPGGLRTWVISILLSAAIFLGVVDVAIRAIGVENFVKYLIGQQIKREILHLPGQLPGNQ